jgi:EAL domain-containing protein (putative c-di-GMP-specific phosphodiesterase class I)
MQPTHSIEGFKKINSIIQDENIIVHLQPLFSIKKKQVIGFEALCRGIDADSGEMIPPGILFDAARSEGLIIELDRLCRKKALEKYGEIYAVNKDILLFLNFDTSIIDMGVVGSGNLINMVNEFNISPGNVVIEIVESKVNDVPALKEFIITYKDYGFLIALDDVGAGHSNLDRIPLVRPDIMKIDRFLIGGLDKKYYKQETFKSLVNLSKKIGALVVAEGVESEAEAICALELGADMLQGFYFARPGEFNSQSLSSFEQINDYMAVQYKNHIYEKISSERQKFAEYMRITDRIIKDISCASRLSFDYVLGLKINEYPFLECIYILDISGIQLTDTYCNNFRLPRYKKNIFSPAKKGTEHSLKDYYYLFINSGQNKYTTEPYISLASGNLCITVSSFINDVNGNKYILCLDFNQDYFIDINH